MNDIFADILNIPPNWITNSVFVICCALCIFPIFYEKWREIAPTLMVSAGITGTFWGTFIALVGFETGAGADAMIDSIPVVLGGMKSAFITSLIGLLSAFVFRICIKWFMPEAEPKPNQIEKGFNDLLRGIKESISDQGDKSLSTQTQRIASTVSRQRQRIKTSYCRRW